MRKINEIGIGSFRPGREPQGRHVRSIDLMGPASNADGVASQRMQYNVGNYDYDEDISYKGLGDEEDQTELFNDETILECRVYRGGKYQLIETLVNLNESYADRFASMMGKISRQSKKRTDDISTLPDAKDVVAQGIKKEDSEIEDDNPLEEFSGAAAGGGGPAVPIGYTAKGKPETPAQRRKRQQFNITKSYPYTKLANPPRKRRK